jgi:hypothetical protein
MKTNDVFPSKYLRGTDLEDREIAATITQVVMEDVGGDDKKPVAYFKSGSKGVVLNKTNWDRIAHISGSDDSDDWAGVRVLLYTELVTFQGKTGPSIRIKKPPPGTSQPGNPAGKEMNDDIPW